MAKRIRYTPEQIITKLREAEVYLSQGKTALLGRSIIRWSISSFCAAKSELWIRVPMNWSEKIPIKTRNSPFQSWTDPFGSITPGSSLLALSTLCSPAVLYETWFHLILTRST